MITALRSFFVFALLAAFFFVPPVVSAATFIVPPDEMLIDDSTAIVSGTIIAAESKLSTTGDIETVFTILVDEVLKGAVEQDRVSLVEWGGRIGDVAMVMSGAPRYEVGRSYLIFMVADRNGNWTTQHLTLGRFERVPSAKGDLLVRDTSQVHGWDIHGNEPVEIDRHAESFCDFVRQRAAGGNPTAEYFVDGIVPPRRVAAKSAVAPHFAEYDFEDASVVGAASWADEPGSDVQYSIGADTGDTVLNLNPGEDKIIEEDPHDLIAGVWTGSGVVAQARWRTTGS